MMKTVNLMIRDVRTIHRGTPNRIGEPRPMCVIGYSRRWLFRPEVSIRIPRGTWESLSEKAKHLLRFNPRVELLDEVDTAEVYQHLLTKLKMENEEKSPKKKVGEMRKRRETMPDGKRYIIYYTFENEEKEPQIEVKENV